MLELRKSHTGSAVAKLVPSKAAAKTSVHSEENVRYSFHVGLNSDIVAYLNPSMEFPWKLSPPYVDHAMVDGREVILV